ncbi:MAG: MFS transporter [Bifidobacteriaceae bacterium]|jgi:predicted MFS family arabinose efflux permease|nr:MFS transporter [Bifidobacteriaceae bacterium]
MTPARAFYLLTFLRWFPVGLALNLTILLPLERGLTVTQTLTLASVCGLAVFALELPTGGLADALGRRPLVVVAAVFQVVAALLFVSAHSFAQFAVSSLATGVFRALDSGPLEAWFVDAYQAQRPRATVAVPLARASTILGAGIATGALAAGGLVAWHPVRTQSALVLPYLVYTALATIYLVAATVLVKEPRRAGVTPAATSVPDMSDAGPPDPSARGVTAGRGAGGIATALRGIPTTLVETLRLVRRSHVLASLFAVEVFWAVAMVVFEAFQPLRLAEFLGGKAEAAAVMGPVACAGWGAFALGAALAGFMSRRLGATLTGMLSRLLNGLGVVAMGLAGGPVTLIAAYLFTYAMHGAGGPVYNALLHRQASPANRTVILSLASMASFASYAIASPLLGRLAEVVSSPAAMVVGGAFSCLGLACFLPAWRQERADR